MVRVICALIDERIVNLPFVVILNLRNAVFWKMDLSGVHLPDCHGSCFDRANLTGARLGSVERASFKGANLERAVFDGNVDFADFTSAILKRTSFKNATYNPYTPPKGLSLKLLKQRPMFQIERELEEKRHSHVDHSPRVEVMDCRLRAVWGD